MIYYYNGNLLGVLINMRKDNYSIRLFPGTLCDASLCPVHSLVARAGQKAQRRFM